MKRRSQMALLALIAAASMSVASPAGATTQSVPSDMEVMPEVIVDDSSTEVAPEVAPVQTAPVYETPIQEAPETAPVASAQGAPVGGANDPNQTTFDPTGTGSSMPGAGGGGAVGMPAAGTVGNADAMDPPGQVGNTTDNGFECAPNPGIGNGNPAHTGCATPVE